MALRRRFLPVFKKHAPRGKPRFAKPLQGHFGPAAKHSQKHKNRPKIGRFSHFNPSAEMHPFSLFSASKAPQKWLCDAICRKKQLFAGSFGSRSHSFCSFTSVASKLLDGLASLITSLIDSFTNLMNFGGEFGNFLAALWPFMPPEITAVLLLGVTLSVLLMVIGFFKK